MSGARVCRHNFLGGCSQPSFCPVSVNRAADFAADGIADAKRVLIAAQGLHNQSRRDPLVPGAGNAQEFAALL